MECSYAHSTLFDHVLVKRTKQDRTTASGLILPDANQEKMNRGVVVSVGSEIR